VSIKKLKNEEDRVAWHSGHRDRLKNRMGSDPVGVKGF
jgi:hypothetical protein